MGARREEALGLRQPQATMMMRCRNMTSEMLAAYSRVKPSGGQPRQLPCPSSNQGVEGRAGAVRLSSWWNVAQPWSGRRRVIAAKSDR